MLHCADFLFLVCSGLSIQRALYLLTLDMWVVEEENDCAYCLFTLRKVPFEREYVDDFPEHHWSNIQALNDRNLLTYVLLVTVLPFRSLALYVGLVRILFI